jgi:hypothetical protein
MRKFILMHNEGTSCTSMKMVAGKQLNVLQCEQQRPGEQVAGRIREARQEPLRNGQVQ